MSRSRRFIGGLSLTYVYQVVLVLVGFWLIPFLLNHIGQHDYGLWLVATQLLAYLSLADFGIVALLPLETAYATGRSGGIDKAQDISEMVGQTTRLVLYQLPVVAAVAIVLCFTLPSNWHGLRGPLSLVVLGFVLTFPLRIFPALLHGLQDLVFLGQLQVSVFVLTTVITILLVIVGWNLYAIAAAWIANQLLQALMTFRRLRKRFPVVLPSRLPTLTWQKVRSQLGKGMWVSVAQVAQMLTSGSDLLIIGKVLGPEAVVPYACTGKLVNVLANQANLLMQVATPGLCELKSGESKARVFQVSVALNQAILTFSGLVFCIVLIINRWFISWWLSPRQYGGFALTVLLLANMIVRHWNTTAAYTVFCFGHQRRISLTNISDGLLTIAATVVLVMVTGPLGAPLASILGASFVSLPLNVAIIARDSGVSAVEMIGNLKSWFWRFIMLLTVAFVVSQLWSPQTLVEASAICVAVALVYSLVMLPAVLQSSLGPYLRRMIVATSGKFVPMRFS